MTQNSAVLVASPDVVGTQLVASLTEQGIRAEIALTRDAAEHLLADASTRWVAIVDTDLPAYDGWQLSRLLQDEHHVPTLLLFPADLASQLSPSSHGIRAMEFALKPLSLNELLLRVKAIMLRAGFTLHEPTPHPRAGAGAEAAGLRALSNGKQSKIVAVFSLKGGSGKSTLAVNTAVGLAQARQQRVLLVDADLWTGDIAVLMNASGHFSVADLCWRSMTEIDLLQQIVAHHPSGVDVLQRPLELTVNEQLRTEPLVKALPIYASVYDFVVVNMSSALDELNLQILDVADVIMLVTTPEIAAITNTARFLEVSRRVGYIDRIKLILNRANSGINTATIEETLHCEVTASLVSDGRAVVESANEGTPLILRDPQLRRPLTQGFMRVVDQLAGTPSQGTVKAAAPSKNVLSFMRKLAG
jgi:pilus assembly protein CpaE